MPDAPLPAVGALILRPLFFTLPECAVESGNTRGEEVECEGLELVVPVESLEGPDIDRFLDRDLAALAKEVPNDILPDTWTGVSGITGSSSSSAL
jgi:hypothetical protein